MPSVSEMLIRSGEEIPPRSRAGQALRRQGVSYTDELERVLKLPRRVIDTSVIDHDITPVWAKPDGKLKLWPPQAWALLEAERAGGLFAPLGVGSGKTLLSILCVDALGSKQAVLLIPPQLRNQLLYKDIPFYSKHFHLEIILPRLKIIAYSELSSPTKATILDEIKPDLIIADECHNLRDRSSARSKRFIRYFKENPGTRFVALSGTITRRSLFDYAHLIRLALKDDKAPIPKTYRELQDWADAIDVSDDPMPPGELMKLVKPCDIKDNEIPESQPVVRRAYRRRLVETTGVVATTEDALGTSLIVQARYPMLPEDLQTRLINLRASGEHEGEVLEDPLAVYRVGKQISSGFYYRWVWPDGKVDEEWLIARANWHREMREFLRYSKKGMDSPFLVASAAADGRIKTEFWKDWNRVRDRYHPTPPTEAVWLDEFLIGECGTWMEELLKTNYAGIIWYESDAFGRLLAERLNLPFFGPGEEASRKLSGIDVKTNRVIVCSIAAHSEGKNLQMYSRALVTSPPGSGKTWEQMIGRIHRPGQEADEIVIDVFLHSDENKACFDKAVKESRYVEQTQGQQQKLSIATRIMK